MADQPSLPAGDEDHPLDVVGGADAPLHVGGGQGEGAGLPGPGALAGGIGQGGAAGIGPGLPAAVADPAMMAVLQQLLASNHAIAARLTCLENSQAHPQQQEQQQQQQPQEIQPPQQGAQPPGGAIAGGLLAPWAGGAMGGQLLPASHDANQQAAISAGVKATAKQAADLWHAPEGPKFFIARGGFNMQEVVTRPLLLMALNEVAFVSDAVTQQLRSLSEFAVEAFYPPLPAGQEPVDMPAEVHFATFVAAFMATLEYGMEGAQAVCRNRVRTVREELEQLQKSVEVYLRRHYKSLLDHKDKVREVLIAAMNVGLQVGMIDLAKQGGVLHRKHRYAAPPAGTGVPMAPLAFTRLRELVEEGAGSSLTERQSFWTQTPEKSGSKRKGAPNAGGQRSAQTQARAGARGGGGSTFKVRMLERGTPPGVCDFAWRGDPCPRVNCTFSHLLPAGKGSSVAGPQPQLQALQPPPPPPPPPPALLHQPPQYQAAAAAGGGTAAGGGGVSRQPSVARFSRNYGVGGRGGASAGGGAGRGNGSI